MCVVYERTPRPLRPELLETLTQNRKLCGPRADVGAHCGEELLHWIVAQSRAWSVCVMRVLCVLYVCLCVLCVCARLRVRVFAHGRVCVPPLKTAFRFIWKSKGCDSGGRVPKSCWSGRSSRATICWRTGDGRNRSAACANMVLRQSVNGFTSSKGSPTCCLNTVLAGP